MTDAREKEIMAEEMLELMRAFRYRQDYLLMGKEIVIFQAICRLIMAVWEWKKRADEVAGEDYGCKKLVEEIRDFGKKGVPR